MGMGIVRVCKLGEVYVDKVDNLLMDLEVGQSYILSSPVKSRVKTARAVIRTLAKRRNCGLRSEPGIVKNGGVWQSHGTLQSRANKIMVLPQELAPLG